jgi:acetyl-CoA C-acetyltransferase
MEEAVIISAVRTPIGSFGGILSNFTAPQLGSIAIKEAINRANIEPDTINEVIIGNVLQAGIGQAPARQAAIGAGVPESVSAMTINKVCSSGLKSVMLASQQIQLGDVEIAVAGGMESMSNCPYYLDKARNGYRMGNGKVIDGMIYDGLWDPYNNIHMGNVGEICAKEYKITREMQDEFAKKSYEKALNAIKNGFLKNELISIEFTDKKGNKTIIDTDEEPGKTNIEKGMKLKPAFDKDGTITAFNASKINDGAAALVIMSKKKAKELGLKPLAKVIAQATHSQKPEWFTTAPAYAIEKLIQKSGLSKNVIDLFEINEAFAVVSCVVTHLAGLDENKINISGGAIAYGHPIGASGARILVTLIHNLIRDNKRYGIASLCNGGGEATALLIEKI